MKAFLPSSGSGSMFRPHGESCDLATTRTNDLMEYVQRDWHPKSVFMEALPRQSSDKGVHRWSRALAVLCEHAPVPAGQSGPDQFLGYDRPKQIPLHSIVHSQSNFPTVSHFVAFQKLHPCCV
jgi:hypothetical protein